MVFGRCAGWSGPWRECLTSGFNRLPGSCHRLQACRLTLYCLIISFKLPKLKFHWRIPLFQGMRDISLRGWGLQSEAVYQGKHWHQSCTKSKKFFSQESSSLRLGAHSSCASAGCLSDANSEQTPAQHSTFHLNIRPWNEQWNVPLIPFCSEAEYQDF